MFYLTTEQHTQSRSTLQRLRELGGKPLFSTTFHLHLMCELPRHMHRLQEPPYTVTVRREWWVRMGPLLYYTLRVARIAVSASPVAGIAVGAAFDFAAELVKSGVNDPLANCDSIKQDTAKLHTVITKQAAALREFSAWMNSIDPAHGFRGLERVKLPTGEVCFVCAEHAKELSTAKVPATVASLPLPSPTAQFASSSDQSVTPSSSSSGANDAEVDRKER